MVNRTVYYCRLCLLILGNSRFASNIYLESMCVSWVSRPKPWPLHHFWFRWCPGTNSLPECRSGIQRTFFCHVVPTPKLCTRYVFQTVRISENSASSYEVHIDSSAQTVSLESLSNPTNNCWFVVCNLPVDPDVSRQPVRI